MLYFAYGSNMSTKRLRKRIPTAKFVVVSYLANHQINFHKAGKDGSAKCNALKTNDDTHFVIGVVFEISASEKIDLDRYEGLAYGYDEKIVTVVSTEGKSIEAVTYYATDIDPALKPYHWYKEHVIRGAEEHKLPQDYIQIVSDIESIDDSDLFRHDVEMEIYR